MVNFSHMPLLVLSVDSWFNNCQCPHLVCVCLSTSVLSRRLQGLFYNPEGRYLSGTTRNIAGLLRGGGGRFGSVRCRYNTHMEVGFSCHEIFRYITIPA